MAWMPAGSPDVNDLRREIEELKERIRIDKEEKLAKRLAKGQRPEPPDAFVEPVLSAALAQQVTPLFNYAASLGNLLSDNIYVPVNLSKFDKYRDEIALLEMSTESKYRNKGLAARHLLKLFEDLSKGLIENKTAARGIYYVFRMTDLLNDELDNMRAEINRFREARGYVEPDYTEIEKQAKQLLADEDRFNQLYEESLAFYSSIESELDGPAYNKFW